MHRFTLPTDNAINGDQLCEEVKIATGLDIKNRYGFIPPRTVEVQGIEGAEALVQAVVESHIPTTATPSPEEVERAQKIQAARLASLKPRAERTDEDIHVIAEAFALVVPPPV